MEGTRWAYVAVAVFAAGVGGYAVHVVDARRLADVQADYARERADLSRAALDAQQRAVAAHREAEAKLAAADAALTKERNAHETENRRYRAALAAGTERLRVAVTGCSAADTDGLSDVAGSTGLGDGAAAFADLDRATAERAFGVAGDDEREIDKLKALQAYVCAVRPDTPGCEP